MTLDPVSIALGFVAAYVFTAVLLLGLAFIVTTESRAAGKEPDEAVDQLIARVAVRCIERPTNERCNR